MTLHNFSPDFAANEKRYAVKYDTSTDVWRILDLWHESLTNISDIDQEMPDGHPAMVVLPGRAVISIMEEIERLGWQQKSVKEVKEETKAEEANINEYEIPASPESIVDNSLEMHAINKISDTILRIVGSKQVQKLNK